MAVFPADTVYGLACDPENADAVAKLYALKGRPPEKPAAVMFFDLARARPATSARLLPGGVTLLLPNPERRFPLACTNDPETLGLRVPFLARRSGGRCCSPARTWPAGPTPAASTRCPASIRAGADLVLDGGELPGMPSTVIDVRDAGVADRAPGSRLGAGGASRAARRRTSRPVGVRGRRAGPLIRYRQRA